jgi:hypothetical protein
MAYIKHSDEWWEVETAWIEQQAALPPGQRKAFTWNRGTFRSYVHMQMIHCGINGPKACTERLKKVLE